MGVERLLDVAAEEVDRGTVVVVVAHDVETFGRLQPKTIRLDRGRVVAD